MTDKLKDHTTKEEVWRFLNKCFIEAMKIIPSKQRIAYRFRCAITFTRKSTSKPDHIFKFPLPTPIYTQSNT